MLFSIPAASRRNPVLEEERDLTLLPILTVFTTHINHPEPQCMYMDKAEVLYREFPQCINNATCSTTLAVY